VLLTPGLCVQAGFDEDINICQTCAHEGHETFLRCRHGSLHRFRLQYSKDYAVSYSTLITPNCTQYNKWTASF